MSDGYAFKARPKSSTESTVPTGYVQWQEFGNWCLVGGYRDRPIYLQLAAGSRVLGPNGILQRFSPESDVAQMLVSAVNDWVDKKAKEIQEPPCVP